MTTIPNLNDPFAYVLSQTRDNIAFLQSVQQISSEDARIILERLPSAPGLVSRNKTPDLPAGLSMPVAYIGLNQWNSPPLPPRSPSAKMPPLSRPPPPIPAPFLFKARAIWGYNEDGKEVDDLPFASGDIIEILDDKNCDWWRGRVNGKQGLFPSSYVEKLPNGAPSRISQNYPDKAPTTQGFSPSPQYLSQAPYPPQNFYYGPPQGGPPNGPYPQYPPPQSQAPLPPPTVVVNEEEGKKKHGLFQGKLGNTLAHSAVGGVGFGAGSAVGGGIINALF